MRYPKNSSYNRVVIVGNGWDLSNGLKTKYSDFIKYHVHEGIKCAFRTGEFSSNLFSINGVQHCNENELNELLNLPISEVLQNGEELYGIGIKPNFWLVDLVKTIKRDGWVDFEGWYFDKLLYQTCYSSEDSGWLIKPEKDINKNSIIELNYFLEGLSFELGLYLKSEDSSFQISSKSKRHSKLFQSFFDADMHSIECLNRKNVSTNGTMVQPPVEVLFLDFNYTNTISKFIKKYPYSNARHIQIHGDIDNLDSIILGYGDDSHRMYIELENLNENECLKMIKAFKYSYSDDYLKLLYSLDRIPYEVFILGHSCGLSDRILLRTIFEHENCLGIKVHYHQNHHDDFLKRISISRHFSNKTLLRERMIPFDFRAKIPQTRTS